MSARCFDGHLFRLGSCGACAAMVEGAKFDEALDLAKEIEAALAEWRDPLYAGAWEHLGDAERDVRVLIRGLHAADELMAGMIPIEQA